MMCLQGLPGSPRSLKSGQSQRAAPSSTMTVYRPLPLWLGTDQQPSAKVIRARSASSWAFWRRASIGTLPNEPMSIRKIVVKIMHNLQLSSCVVHYFGYNVGMARPRKEKSDRKDYDLRIPLTAAQKELIVQAARAEGVDTAAWARPILLQAAGRRIGPEKTDASE